jgi:outer membrane receptor protein involved in Fe transport
LDCEAERAAGRPCGLDDDRAQLMSRVGGNPDVTAEKAKIFTAGIVVTPKGSKFLDGLSLTVDYFSIKVTNAISVKTPEVILNNCYNTATPADCNLITRDAQGFVDSIIDLNTNVGGLTTTGVDFGVVYALPTDFGTFRLNFDGVLLGKFDDIQATRTVKAKDVYDLNEVHPSLRFNTGIGWGFEGLTAGFNTRYTSSLTECELNDCSQEARDAFKMMADEALAADPTFDDTIFHERKVHANAVSDLYAGYSFSSSMGFTSIQAGINNLFNSAPPRIFNGFLANSDAENYDFLGRYFYVGLRHSL